MFVATLAGVFKFAELPEKYGPFVQYKASLEDKNIKDTDDIAILDISGTESVHVLFLDSYQSIKEIDDELKAADAKLNHSSKQVLEGYL
ncbi:MULTISPECIES: DUF749 domain-containing protein [Methanobacterium]|uniref:DUF749 domain-containing protein n=1 Tax=Methanobacterium formicicum TaxID=2162 RepID=A0A090JTR9_METFO|nr:MULTISPECIES: DUF749 domain-containing protein [Methanobacterium]AIS31312.1 hypothetical protein BRM9_0489 [Methanobacterium formicicum]KUK75285.1 MAG: Uncharacterized protein XD90_0483 [Methanobacterium sp. 42_16]MBF4475551.1 DUF749 domain-containing protein [Methanobacterium formicicum]MDD4810655.1 DUF749 domain-containing protein [Methanobacterium formicicum]MDG3547842.1 DUF749 domain-containing protein [Methanobacterium formicicum]